MRVSAIGLGTWQFGSRDWGYGDSYATRTAADLVRHALDAGVNLIDTAEVYGFGASERIVGAAVAGRDEEAFVATKLFPVLPHERVVVHRAHASAARLGHRPIDLYQLHWPNPVVPLGTTVAGLRAVLDDGTVARIGVSNHSADRWYEVERQLGRPVVSNQVAYNLVDRRPEHQLLGYAAARDRIVIAYSPLAQGLLGGRYDAEHPPPGPARRANPLLWPENLERAAPLLDALREVAAGRGLSCAQVALAWVLRHPHVVAIPGASSVAQLEGNVEAAAVTLTDAEVQALTTARDTFRPLGGVAALRRRLDRRRGASSPPRSEGDGVGTPADTADDGRPTVRLAGESVR